MRARTTSPVTTQAGAGAVAAPVPGLIETKLIAPGIRPGVVQRVGPLRRLRESTGSAIVSVVAPAGYGKTSVLAQWAAEDPRPFAWLSLDARDNDPVLLLHYVRASFQRAGLVRPPDPAARPPVEVSSWPAMIPPLATAIAGEHAPCVLVLDDVEYLIGESIDALATLARAYASGCQLVLSGRAELTTIVAPARASGELVELRTEDLALTDVEARELLASVSDGLEEGVADEVISRSEGWAAGIYLAGLAAAEAPASSPGTTFGSVDRSIEDYLQTEHLSRLPRKQLTFLTRTSVLDRLHAGLCDAVLERRDSARTLDAIERSNLFLVPLDRERRWFRYHELFRSALRRELDRSDAEAVPELRRRAADWCEANELPEDAIAYAIASADLDRVARLFVSLAFPLYRSGRIATLERWLTHFDSPEVIGRYPAVAVLGAWAYALLGNAARAERWAEAAERGKDDTDPLPDGSPSVRPWVALTQALLCRQGPVQMQVDAEQALAELGPFSPFRAPAMWLVANAILLQGDTAAADVHLEKAADAAAASGATFIAVNAPAQRALLALEREDLPAARALIARARSFVPGEGSDDYLALAMLLAAEARVEILAGRTESARGTLAAAERLRPRLNHSMPFYSVQALLQLARTYLSLGDVNGARTALSDAGEVLRRRGDLGALTHELAKVRELLRSDGRPRSGRESSLTSAELRLLPLLTTHLSFREIGERLFVSRNTVKTQAISIYRKLGASSRSEAVERAAELGLVGSAALDVREFTPSG